MGMLDKLGKIKDNSFIPTNRQAGTLERIFEQLLEQVVAWLNRLSPLALLLSLLWLCWVLAQLLWLLLAPPTAPRLPVVALQPTTIQTVPQDTYMVFANPIPQVPVNQPPPDVKVQGVMVATPAHLSSAILLMNGVSQGYGINDPLANSGYTLAAVFWDKVMIADANGQTMDIPLRESMQLDQPNAFANPATGMMPQTLATLPTDVDGFGVDDFGVDGFGDVGGFNGGEHHDLGGVNAFEQAADELRHNPAGYLSRMGVMAVGDGYQVTDAMPSDIKNRLGLESGDRVISVNGQSVGSNPMQDADVIQQVQQSGTASIQVQRGEQVITIRQQF